MAGVLDDNEIVHLFIFVNTISLENSAPPPLYTQVFRATCLSTDLIQVSERKKKSHGMHSVAYSQQGTVYNATTKIQVYKSI